LANEDLNDCHFGGLVISFSIEKASDNVAFGFIAEQLTA
jgi:hypothetical protein